MLLAVSSLQAAAARRVSVNQRAFDELTAAARICRSDNCATTVTFTVLSDAFDADKRVLQEEEATNWCKVLKVAVASC